MGTFTLPGMDGMADQRAPVDRMNPLLAALLEQVTAGNVASTADQADAGPKQLPGEVEPGNFLIDGIVDWGLDDDGGPAAEVKWHKWGHAHNTVVKLDLIGHDSSLVRTFIRKLER